MEGFRKTSSNFTNNCTLVSVVSFDSSSLSEADIKYPNHNFEEEAAVVVRNAVKCYSNGEKVLDGLNMTVPCGSIYALTGSSGCGKSTTLACILGIRKLDRGDIYLYGARVGEGSRVVAIPGRNVGYMSQDISLYSEFTIDEMLKYFGVLCGVALKQIEISIEFLSHLLQLPDGTRFVGSLSGGQQRRVSFASALVHNPKLIILDEPTVGVDPILSKKIWSHLTSLVSSKKVTVIVTTHYLEEARKCQKIGVMRNGVLQAECSPDQLLQKTNTSTLEDAVLSLFKLEESQRSRCHDNQVPLPQMATLQMDMEDRSSEIRNTIWRLGALISANIAAFSRNRLFTSFIILIPTIFLTIICLTQGRTPYDISFGVVNHELDYDGNPVDCLPPGISNSTQCDMTMLSCQFLQKIPEGSLTLVPFHTETEAVTAVQQGFVWGFLTFPSNFSEGFFDRAALGINVTEDVLNASSIIARLDETNKIVLYGIEISLLKTLQKFVRDLLSACGFDPEKSEYALQYSKPIFGGEGLDFIASSSVSFALSGVFFFPIISAGTRFLTVRENGMLERSQVCGMRMWEFILAYVLSESIVLILQIVLMTEALKHIFGMQNQGSLLLIYVLNFLAGCGGISIGLLVGTVAREKIQVAIFALAFILPNIVLTGILWPKEDMPEVFQGVVNFLPCTLPGEALRSIYNRGWDLYHPNVWPGFAILICYSVVFNCFTLICHYFGK